VSEAQVSPYQGQLLDPESGKVGLATGIFPDDPAEKLLGDPGYPVVYGKPGTFVDLSKRAELLTNALTALGFRNQRLGFDAASNTPQYQDPIYAMYHGRVPVVQQGARRNLLNYQDEAKWNFWKATGFNALQGAGLINNRYRGAQGSKMWREFLDDYNAPNKRQSRDHYKKTLARTVKLSQMILQRNA
jgi:hypothetical protein